MQIEDYDMVNFLPLNIKDEDSLSTILFQIDTCTQYGEDVEPKEPKEDQEYESENYDQD